MGYDKHTYNLQYKKDHFDNISFYVPKGTKDKINSLARTEGVSLSEYMRNLVNKAIEKDTQ